MEENMQKRQYLNKIMLQVLYQNFLTYQNNLGEPLYNTKINHYA